jgi:hypothetical protein
MKKVAIVQSNYIPWKGYFDMINSVDEFIILDEVQFTKNDWRNRNKIKTRNGSNWLTIPVRHEHLNQKISAVKVSDERWAEKHWKTLIHNYSRARHFADYAPHIEKIYADSAHLEFLSEINLRFIHGLCALAGIKTKISLCTAYALQDDRVSRLVDICRQSGAKTYVSGPAAKSYLDEPIFAAAGLTVEWIDYSGYGEYEQLFPPFAHNVSLLDLLFNAGTQHRSFMKSFALAAPR